jgi:peptide/nickel transport system substrate-binding protein
LSEPGRIEHSGLDSRMPRRAFLTRSAATGLLLSVPGSLLAACGGGASKSGGTLRIGLGASTAGGWVQSLDPAFENSESDVSAIWSIFQGLVQWKPGTVENVNVLAESMETSSDGKEIKFVLRPGSRFQHGYGELTAEDVKHSYERVAGLIDKKLGSYYTTDFTNLEGVKVTGRYEGVLRYSKPFAPTFISTLPETSGVVAPKKALEKSGKGFGRSPVGTGPYQLASFTKQEIVLERFPGYDPSISGVPKPWYDEIRLVHFTGSKAIKTALLSGSLDWGAVNGSDVVDFEGTNLEIHQPTSSLFYEWIAMNVQDPVLKDVGVRQAIRYAVDVPGIIEAAFNNKAQRATSILPPGVLGYWKDAPVYDRNIDRARSLLATAGQDGAKLTFTTGNSSPGPTIAQIVQSNLKDVGLDVKIDVLEQNIFGATTGHGFNKWQLSYNHFSSTPDPFFFTEWFACGNIFNVMRWCNPEYTRLNRQAAVTLDRNQRAEMYVKMQQLMDRDAVAVWLDWPVNWWVGAKSVKPAFTQFGDFLAVNFRRA